MSTEAVPFSWSDAWSSTQLAGSSMRLKLNIGREPGTKMPEQWAASGARLALPVEVTFTDEVVPGGSLRWNVEEPACCPARVLRATAGRFVGAQGEVSVQVEPGGWLAEPADRCGQEILRFYLDFPAGAVRNDASIPAGRVFFRAAMWDGEELSTYQAERAAVQADLDAYAGAAAEGSLIERAQALTSERAETLRYHLEALDRSLPDARGVVAGPRGVQLAASGEVCVKANGMSNLWGALSDRFLTIGHFSFAPSGGGEGGGARDDARS